MARSRHAPAAVRARILEAKALEMRRAGHPYREIGRSLGVSHEGARQAVCRAMAHTARPAPEVVDEARVLQAIRLDEMHQALWPRAAGGDPGAVRLALRIMDRRARLHGLDAPDRHEVEATTDDESMILDRLERLAGSPQATSEARRCRRPRCETMASETTTAGSAPE